MCKFVKLLYKELLYILKLSVIVYDLYTRIYDFCIDIAVCFIGKYSPYYLCGRLYNTDLLSIVVLIIWSGDLIQGFCSITEEGRWGRSTTFSVKLVTIYTVCVSSKTSVFRPLKEIVWQRGAGVVLCTQATS